MSSYINSPKLSEKEMEEKLSSIRAGLAVKINKWADRIQVSMAHTPKIDRVEGETFTEYGKSYIIKNGIKQAVSVTQDARMPWWCPKCSKPMNHRFDRKFYYLRNWCYNCNIEWEGQLRIDGKWEAFEKRMVRENEKAFLRDKIQEHQDYIRTFTVPTVYFENGGFERLADISMFEQKFSELEADIEFCINRLEQIAEEEAMETYDGLEVAVTNPQT